MSIFALKVMHIFVAWYNMCIKANKREWIILRTAPLVDNEKESTYNVNIESEHWFETTKMPYVCISDVEIAIYRFWSYIPKMSFIYYNLPPFIPNIHINDFLSESENDYICLFFSSYYWTANSLENYHKIYAYLDVDSK